MGNFEQKATATAANHYLISNNSHKRNAKRHGSTTLALRDVSEYLDGLQQVFGPSAQTCKGTGLHHTHPGPDALQPGAPNPFFGYRAQPQNCKPTLEHAALNSIPLRNRLNSQTASSKLSPRPPQERREKYAFPPLLAIVLHAPEK